MRRRNTPTANHSTSRPRHLCAAAGTFLIVLGVALAPAQQAAPRAAEPFDVLIVNGRIVDGSGNAWFYGDVGIRDDRIARITPPTYSERTPRSSSVKS